VRTARARSRLRRRRPARACEGLGLPIPRLAPALDQRVDPEAEADPGHGCPPISSSPTLSERISTSPARSLRTTASAIARRPIASAPIAAAASASGAMTVGAMARGPTTCGPMKRPLTAAESDRCRMRFVRFMTVPFRRFSVSFSSSRPSRQPCRSAASVPAGTRARDGVRPRSGQLKRDRFGSPATRRRVTVGVISPAIQANPTPHELKPGWFRDCLGHRCQTQRRSALSCRR